VADADGAFPSSVRATAHTYLERLDDTVVLSGDDAHHLARVRRVRAGEVLTGADGHGRWRVYDVAEAGTRGLDLRATTEVRHEPRLVPALTVAFALTKGDRPELVVQKLTELGVDAMVLLRAARSVVRWDDARAASAIERLRRVAREAGAQSRRARVPLVDGPIEPRALVGTSGLIVAGTHGGSSGELALPEDGEWVVVVGPEGGFDDEELAGFGDAPRLTIGPHVLRAETAAIAVGAALAGRRHGELGA
jgi:16S rRNA (uracil1498-N3)-methyltransferase